MLSSRLKMIVFIMSLLLQQLNVVLAAMSSHLPSLTPAPAQQQLHIS